MKVVIMEMVKMINYHVKVKETVSDEVCKDRWLFVPYSRCSPVPKKVIILIFKDAHPV